jgi:hypothetical protein
MFLVGVATKVRAAAVQPRDQPRRRYSNTGSMPTPVGPAPRDPDDPDFWDWGGDDHEPAARRHPARAAVAAIVVVAFLVMMMVASLR